MYIKVLNYTNANKDGGNIRYVLPIKDTCKVLNYNYFPITDTHTGTVKLICICR